LGAKQLAERETVDARHLEIECDEIATHALEDAQRRTGFGRGHDTILRSLEDVAQTLACSRVVVNY
jgi:hypothetical protein